MNEQINKKYLARLIVGDCGNRPVVFIPNSKQPPKVKGHSFYHTTPGGRIVHHPNAYGYRTVYHASTIHTTVGENWVPKIPKGMKLLTKGGTHLVRLSDGMDLHFSAGTLLRKDFCTWARKEMANNYRKRIQTQRLQKLFYKHARTVSVNFTDARQAGNCVQGILEYAKRKLNLEKERLLQAPWLCQVPAKLLLRLDPNNKLVINSITRAIMRETAVCI
jgi:hypothetical protein